MQCAACTALGDAERYHSVTQREGARGQSRAGAVAACLPLLLYLVFVQIRPSAGGYIHSI